MLKFSHLKPVAFIASHWLQAVNYIPFFGSKINLYFFKFMEDAVRDIQRMFFSHAVQFVLEYHLPF